MSKNKLFILLMLLLLFGCQASPKKAELKKPKKPPAKTKKMASPLPKKFPPEVPVYPKGNIIYKASSNGSWSLAISTPEGGDQIFGWYYDELTGKNWNVTTSFYDVAKNFGAIKAALGPLQIQLEIRPKQQNQEISGTDATLTVSKK